MGSAEIKGDATIVAAERQVSTDIEGESVILNFDDGIYYGLEGVGARIWELLREPRRISELRDTLASEYEVDPDRCESDLRELVVEMREAGLVEVSDG